MNIIEACRDPNLFQPWFRDPTTWRAWEAFLAALFALPMNDEQVAIYRACTGRSEAPTEPFCEAWLICGRRAGKSFTLALIAVFLAFKDYREHLAPGEAATVRVMAADRDQARTIFRYIGAMLREVPMLSRLVERETADTFELSTRTVIEVGTASYRGVRGYSFAAVLIDEGAFLRWTDDSTNPDIEVLRAARPGLKTIPGSMLLIASSPYARKGILWEAYQANYGRDDAEALVWKASTTTMNPTIPQAEIDKELANDPAGARAEYLAEFRSDIESFISLDAVRACIDEGTRERPPNYDRRYWAFVDPSGGSNDSMALAIAHREGNTVFVDAVREIVAPFDPESAVAEFAITLKRYRLKHAVGDRYAAEWVVGAFRRAGIAFEHSEQTKSELYLDLLPLINSGGVRLLDDTRAINQIVALERRTHWGGRDSIDHPRGLHDDVANAVAGACVVASTRATTWRNEPRGTLPTVEGAPPSSDYPTGTAWMGL